MDPPQEKRPYVRKPDTNQPLHSVTTGQETIQPGPHRPQSALSSRAASLLEEDERGELVRPAHSAYHNNAQYGSRSSSTGDSSTSAHDNRSTTKVYQHPSHDGVRHTRASEDAIVSSDEEDGEGNTTAAEDDDTETSESGEAIPLASDPRHPHGHAPLLSDSSVVTTGDSGEHHPSTATHGVGSTAGSSEANHLRRIKDANHSHTSHSHPSAGKSRQSPHSAQIPANSIASDGIVCEKLRHQSLSSEVLSPEHGSDVDGQSQSQHSAKGLGITAGSGVSSRFNRPFQATHWPPGEATLDPHRYQPSQRVINDFSRTETENRQAKHLGPSSHHASGKQPASSHVPSGLWDSHVTSSRQTGPPGPPSPFFPCFIWPPATMPKLTL